ncbi:hypothetical protein [Variovorax atrisoli]|uniref:hypothetical protein n=1 Tax=Variovorax atrisoli TaxID=3394203 RepID=UPI00197F1DC0|nr:hypothetical protein [Variovorax sp. 369]
MRSDSVKNPLGGKPPLTDELRLERVNVTAMISLLLEDWFEPPMAHCAHLSTLVHQMLSYVAQNGGTSIRQPHTVFCAPGTPFIGLDKGEFVELVYLG